ncbi:MAG TPA: EamA family transporter [Steroidobacteraceae bacterium]|nr:EamA family transporter [Steroidobacteraceae bacterium]
MKFPVIQHRYLNASSRQRALRIVACFAILYFVWGSTYVVNKFGLHQLPPMLLGGTRFTLAGLIMVTLALARGARIARTRREWRDVLVMGLIGVAISNATNLWALQFVAANQSALINASSAFWIAALGTLGPKGNALSMRARLGLGVGFAGVALILWPKGGFSGTVHWAELAILFACFLWATCTMYYRHMENRLATFMFVGLQMLSGGLAMLTFGWLAGEASRWSWEPPGLIALGYLVIFGSCLAYAAFAYLTLNTTPARLGTYSYVNPAVACLLAWIFLGETIAALQFAGMAVILVGVALVTLESPRAGHAAASEDEV